MVMGLSIKDQVVASKIVAIDGSGQFTDIQSAMDDLPAGGGVVYIKEGTYTISTPISFPYDNIRLEGAGNATKIYLANGSNCDCITTNDKDGITIMNLEIDGNQDNNDEEVSYGIYGTNASDRLSINHCYIHQCYYAGIYFYGVNANISDNFIEYCNDNKITFFGGGIFIYGSGYININSNQVSHCGYNGIGCYGGYGLLSITGNILNDNDHYGIMVSTGTIATITGNLIAYNGYHGITCFGSNQTITGNFFRYNSNGNNNIWSDVIIQGARINNVISGNRFFASDEKYCVEEKIDSGTPNYNLIVGNVLTGAVTANIFVVGANTLSANNVDH